MVLVVTTLRVSDLSSAFANLVEILAILIAALNRVLAFIRANFFFHCSSRDGSSWRNFVISGSFGSEIANTDKQPSTVPSTKFRPLLLIAVNSACNR